MRLEVRRFADPGEFLARANAFLLAREALHTMAITAVGRLRRGTAADRRGGYLATVERDGEVVLAAARVPGLSLSLTTADDVEAIEPLVADIADAARDLSGVNGPADLAERFAVAWAARTGGSTHLAMRMRLFVCERPRPPAEDVPGALRAANHRDRDLLVDWLEAFNTEAVPHQPRDREGTAEAVDRLLSAPEPRLFLWEDDERPVSMAVSSHDPPASPRISGVYTPPALRRRGYAAACVSAVSASLLDAGHQRVLLFTDLANPTSNRVYQRIGFEPLADFADHALE